MKDNFSKDIKTILDKHTAVLNEHSTDIKDIKSSLEEHTGDIKDIKSTLNEHTNDIKDIKFTLNEHTDDIKDIKFTLNEHSKHFDSLEELMAKFWDKQLEMDQKLSFLVDQVVTTDFNSKTNEKILDRHEKQISKIDLRLKVLELKKKF